MEEEGKLTEPLGPRTVPKHWTVPGQPTQRYSSPGTKGHRAPITTLSTPRLTLTVAHLSHIPPVPRPRRCRSHASCTCHALVWKGSLFRGDRPSCRVWVGGGAKVASVASITESKAKEAKKDVVVFLPALRHLDEPQKPANEKQTNILYPVCSHERIYLSGC